MKGVLFLLILGFLLRGFSAFAEEAGCRALNRGEIELAASYFAGEALEPDSCFSADQDILLLLASTLGGAEKAKALIASGANVKAQDKYGQTPLHFAAMHGRLNIAEALLEGGADPGAQDKYGQTPLHFAAMHGRLNIAEALLEGGADMERKNLEGDTPFDLALSFASYRSARFLAENTKGFFKKKIRQLLVQADEIQSAAGAAFSRN